MGLVLWLELWAVVTAFTSPTLVFSFQRNKNVAPRAKIYYCTALLWPRGSVRSLILQWVAFLTQPYLLELAFCYE